MPDNILLLPSQGAKLPEVLVCTSYLYSFTFDPPIHSSSSCNNVLSYYFIRITLVKCTNDFVTKSKEKF